MLFGNPSNGEFIRLVLGVDQQQTLSMLQGLMFQTFFLDGFAGRTATLGVLNDLIAAFGLIGFTLLALNRSWWTVQVFFSWLVLTMLLVLGGRGDVLFTPLDQEMSRFKADLEKQKEIVTGYETAVDSVRTNFGVGPQFDEVILPNSVRFPTLGEQLTATWKQHEASFEKLNTVGGFTPMVYVLYVFNTVKYHMIKNLAMNLDVDILRRTALANKIAGGKLYPTTQYFMGSFARQCAPGMISLTGTSDPLALALQKNDLLYLSPEEVGPMRLPGTDKTIEQTLTSKKFTVGTVYQMQREYFNDDVVPVEQKMVVGFPVLEYDGWEKALSEDMPATWAYYSLSSSAFGESKNALVRYSASAEKGGVDKEEYERRKSLMIQSAVPGPDSLNREGTLVLAMYKNKGFAAGEGTTSGTEPEKVAISDCWDMFKEFYTAHNEQFSPPEVAVRVAEQAQQIARSQALGIDANGELVMAPGGMALQNGDDLLQVAHAKCQQSCGNENCDQNLVSGGSFADSKVGPQADPVCEKDRTTYTHIRAVAKSQAIDAGMASIAAAEAHYRDASEQFTGTIRSIGTKIGAKLGEVVLWFFALFGGFAAGAYSAIIPSFMNFTLMLIFALSPFMFMMGVLMPGWAPQILITPIVVVAYLKLVELMFVVVGIIFTALKSGLVAAGLIGDAGIMDVISGDPNSIIDALYNIVVGMAYTSMFAIAGFMLSGVRSPERLLGAIASQGDKIGQISGGEALKAGAAALALAKTGQKVAAVPFKAVGAVNRGIGVVGAAKDQIDKHGLGEGLGNITTGLFGSLRTEREKAVLGFQKKIDGADATHQEFDAHRETFFLPSRSSAFEAAKRQQDRLVKADREAKEVARRNQLDKRNTQEPKADIDGVAYEGPAPFDQSVGKLSQVVQQGQGVNAEHATILVQNAIVEAQVESNELIKKDIAALPSNLSSQERAEQEKAIRDKYAVMTGSMDKSSKTVETTLNTTLPAIRKILDNNLDAARKVLGDIGADGRVSFQAPMRAPGVSRSSTGSTPNGGARGGSGGNGGGNNNNGGNGNDGGGKGSKDPYDYSDLFD